MPLSKPRNTSGYGPPRERKNRSHNSDHESSRRKPFLEYVKLGPDFGHEMRLSRLPPHPAVRPLGKKSRNFSRPISRILGTVREDESRNPSLDLPIPADPEKPMEVLLPELEGSIPIARPRIVPAAAAPPTARRQLADNGLLQSQALISTLSLRPKYLSSKQRLSVPNPRSSVENRSKRQSGIYYGRNLDPSLLSLATGNMNPKWWHMFGCFRA